MSEKFRFCPKNNGFARVWGAAAPSPLARTPMGDKRHQASNDFGDGGGAKLKNISN